MTFRLPRPLVWTLALGLATSAVAHAKDKPLSDEVRLAVTTSALSAEQLDRPVVGPGEGYPAPTTAKMATVVREGPMEGLPVDSAKEPAPALGPVPEVTPASPARTIVPEAEPVAPVPSAVPGAPRAMPDALGDLGATNSLLLVSAIDHLTRSIDEQRMLTVVEARLSDKQRLIDGLQEEVRRMGAPQTPALPAPTPASASPMAPATATAPAAAAETPTPSTPAVEKVDPALAALAQQQRQLLEAMAQQQAAMAELQKRSTQVPEATAPAPPEGEREARGSEVDPQVLELRELVEEQRLALAALQEQAAAPRTTTERPPVVAPVPVAAGSSDRDDERIDALRAELDERTKALADAQWKMQYHLDQQATAPQVVAPAPGATAQEMEIARLQAELAAARQAPVASPTPAAVLGVPQESDLRAEIEALRQQLEEGQQGSASETAKVREMVLATEEDRLRMEELAGRLDQLSADKAQLAAQLADADTERAAQLEAERQAAEARSSAMQAELARLQTRTKEMEERYMGRYESLLAQLQPLIDSGLNVRVVAGKIRVDLPSDVLFGSGSATLSRNGRAEVQAVAKALTPFRNLLVQVEGHTDSVPVKSFKYESNYDLAYARAKEVMSVLLEGGLPPERVSAASFGDTRPVASNGTREGRAENRRIELDLELMPVE